MLQTCPVFSQDVASAALLDITNNRTAKWLKRQMQRLTAELGTRTVFYVDSGNTFHTPTYFEVSREPR